MSLFDKLRRKKTTAVDEHGDKMGQGIDKAADVADDKTGGKYDEQIDAGAEKSKDALDSLDGKDDDIGARPPA
jgi:MT0933-like antitoxin protein